MADTSLLPYKAPNIDDLTGIDSDAEPAEATPAPTPTPAPAPAPAKGGK